MTEQIYRTVVDRPDGERLVSEVQSYHGVKADASAKFADLTPGTQADTSRHGDLDARTAAYVAANFPRRHLLRPTEASLHSPIPRGEPDTPFLRTRATAADQNSRGSRTARQPPPGPHRRPLTPSLRFRSSRISKRGR